MLHPRSTRRFTPPPAVGPGDDDAWYRPEVRTQYRVGSAVVTIRTDSEDRLVYRVRRPVGDRQVTDGADAVSAAIGPAPHERPLTRMEVRRRRRQGPTDVLVRAAAAVAGADRPMGRRIIDRLHRRWWCWGRLTELASDESVMVVEQSRDRQQVYLQHESVGGVVASMDPADPLVEHLSTEEVAAYTVRFAGMPIEVRICADDGQIGGPFRSRYIAQEPVLTADDETVIERGKRELWELHVDPSPANRLDQIIGLVEDTLREEVGGPTGGSTGHADAPKAHLSTDGEASPGIPRWAQFERCRYHILRDYVGEGPLTIPLRDPHLEDIEANRVGERIKVVPRATLGLEDARIPTNLRFEDEARFSTLVRQLAASDGTQLNAASPSAKVNLTLEDHDEQETIRCAVALPTISADGPHVSIRKQPAAPMTPMTLVERGTISPALVALVWVLLEHRGVILFSGPTGVGKTTLLNAHMPLIPADQRPITIDEGSQEVFLPHETGIALTTREHDIGSKQVTMADLMTEANYLNPDVEVIAEVNTPESFRTFAEVLNTGHGVLGTTHAEDIDALVNRVIEQGVPAYLVSEIDLVVFPRRHENHRYVGSAVEMLSQRTYERLPAAARTDVIRKDGSTLYTNEVFWRGADGAPRLAYEHPTLDLAGSGPGDREYRGMGLIDMIARRTDQPPAAVESSFHAKVELVGALTEAGVTDMPTLIELIASHRIDPAATRARVEQLRG